MNYFFEKSFFCFLTFVFILTSPASSGGGSSSPLIIKEIFAKDRELCSDFFSYFNSVAINNYEKLSSHQKDALVLSYLTTGSDSLLGFSEGDLLLWSRGDFKYESKGGIKSRGGEFLFADVNNDSIKEYVVKVKDSNDLSDGYGWWVFSDFDPFSDDYAPLKSLEDSLYFTYRDNNINGSYGDGYEVVSRNFHFDFSRKDGRVYVLLMLHYGFEFVFRENLIVADLGTDFRINNQFCHYELTMNDQK